jgi:hypothetical protein
VDVENIATLIATRAEEVHVILNEVGVQDREIRSLRELVLHLQAVVTQSPAAGVIKGAVVAVLHRVAKQGRDSPGSLHILQPYGIVRLPDVGTVTDGDEALQIESDLLSSKTQGELALRQGLSDRDKALLEVEAVLINLFGARDSGWLAHEASSGTSHRGRDESGEPLGNQNAVAKQAKHRAGKRHLFLRARPLPLR